MNAFIDTILHVQKSKHIHQELRRTQADILIKSQESRREFQDLKPSNNQSLKRRIISSSVEKYPPNKNDQIKRATLPEENLEKQLDESLENLRLYQKVDPFVLTSRESKKMEDLLCQFEYKERDHTPRDSMIQERNRIMFGSAEKSSTLDYSGTKHFSAIKPEARTQGISIYGPDLQVSIAKPNPSLITFHGNISKLRASSREKSTGTKEQSLKSRNSSQDTSFNKGLFMSERHDISEGDFASNKGLKKGGKLPFSHLRR